MKRLFFTLGALLLLMGSRSNAAPFAIKNGDTIVFYGDSITAQRLYTVFTEAYIVTRFPHLNVRFVHSGWGGDTVYGGAGGPIDLRLDRDVIAYKPTVMTIMLGMNDAGYRPFDQNLYDRYKAGYIHILEKMKAALPDLRFTLIQPSPYDDITRNPNFDGGYNQVLVKYGQFVKNLAIQNKDDCVDFNAPMVAMLIEANHQDPTLAQKMIPDRVHPSPGGHLVMAEQLIKEWKGPSLVSSVTINGAKHKVVEKNNTSISNLKANANSISWTEADNCLPMPYDMKDPLVMLAINSSDFIQKLDREILKVTNAPAENYELKIDGQDIGSFTNKQLSNGVNLANYSTPMMQQAMDVLGLTFQHNNIHADEWYSVEVPNQNNVTDQIKEQEAKLNQQEADIIVKQRQAAIPKPHHFELDAQ